MSGSRLDGESTCIRCGGVIISLNPKLKMCTACEKKTCEDVSRRVANRKESTKAPRRKIKINMLHGMRLTSKR